MTTANIPLDTSLITHVKSRVYLVGLRYKHHAQHSGYEAYGRHTATFLPAPVNFRWTLGKWGWTLNQSFVRLTRHPWYSLGAHLAELSALKHMLRYRNCLYHILYGDSDLWLLRRANHLTGNRLVATFHQPTAILSKLGFVERVAKHLDAVILVSHSQRAYFEQFVPAHRIFVVPHGVDTSFFQPARTAPSQKRVITVGSHLRDFNTLKEALQLVWRSEPTVEFIAIGARSDQKSYFPPLQDQRAHFLDHIDDNALLQNYQSATLAVFAFQEATANNAMLEAMATGLPIVATDPGGISEYIPPRNGILCPPGDAQALATAIIQVLNNPTLRYNMSAASRQRVLELDFRLIAQRMASIYAQILAPQETSATIQHVSGS